MPGEDSVSTYSVSVRTRENDVRIIPAKSGDSLMVTIRAAGIDEVLAICGGCASCGTCHVYVTDQRLRDLPALSDDEEAVLDCSDYRQANSRLSCQIPFRPELDGLEVTIAPED